MDCTQDNDLMPLLLELGILPCLRLMLLIVGLFYIVVKHIGREKSEPYTDDEAICDFLAFISSTWTQVYPTKNEYSTVFLKFDNLELLGNTTTSPKTLEKLEDYAHYTNLYDLYDGSIIMTTKDSKEEHKVVLSRDNKLPKDVTNRNVVIDKIEYRKIDGVKKHLDKYTGQLEKRDVDGEIRITYKNGDSKTSVFKD